jgi:hypothetical protein
MEIGNETLMAECQKLLRETILNYGFQIRGFLWLFKAKNLSEVKDLRPVLEYLVAINELQEAKKTIAILELMADQKIEEYKK